MKKRTKFVSLDIGNERPLRQRDTCSNEWLDWPFPWINQFWSERREILGGVTERKKKLFAIRKKALESVVLLYLPLGTLERVFSLVVVLRQWMDVIFLAINNAMHVTRSSRTTKFLSTFFNVEAKAERRRNVSSVSAESLGINSTNIFFNVRERRMWIAFLHCLQMLSLHWTTFPTQPTTKMTRRSKNYFKLQERWHPLFLRYTQNRTEEMNFFDDLEWWRWFSLSSALQWIEQRMSLLLQLDRCLALPHSFPPMFTSVLGSFSSMSLLFLSLPLLQLSSSSRRLFQPTRRSSSPSGLSSLSPLFFFTVV